MSAHFMTIPLKGDLANYGALLVFVAVAFGVSLFLLLLSFWRGAKRPNPEKLSAYECGFEPFGNARMKFDVRFYLVALLFIIFDLEVAFLFPWAISLRQIGLYGFFSMLMFLAVLGIGLLYEWKKGALEWE